MSMRIRRATAARWPAIGSALLLVAATLIATLSSATPAAAHPINAADFQQVELAQGVAEMGEPMSLAVLPDRSVLHTARNGTAAPHRRRRHHHGDRHHPRLHPRRGGPAGRRRRPGLRHQPAHLPLLRAAAVHPGRRRAGHRHATGRRGRASTGSPGSPSTPTSRSTSRSKVDVLDVPADRGICCHVGGDIDFDAAGNLYLSTGDDTNPFDSAGYSPLDERTNRNPAYDAQRSAGNTNDLRGKILRIKVNANGTYSIPAGNLFAARHRADPARDLRDGLPQPVPDERRQGHRRRLRRRLRPGRRHHQRQPRAPAARSSSTGSPARATTAGRTAPAPTPPPRPTTSGTSPPTPPGAKYNCAGGPTNNSFRNTGLTTLPAGQAGLDPVRRRRRQPAGVRRRLRVADGRPGLPVRRRADLDHEVPAVASTGSSSPPSSAAAGSSRSTSTPTARRGTIDSFPWTGKQVMDSAFGPDGALLRAGLRHRLLQRRRQLGALPLRLRRRRQPGARPRVASADRTSGAAPLTVTFSSAGSSDPEGGALTYSWASATAPPRPRPTRRRPTPPTARTPPR